MSNYDKEYLNTSKLWWDKFRLYNENERIEKSKQTHRWAAIYNRYKLTRDEWQAIFDRQNGCCAICGVSQENFTHPLEIDFDQTNRKIRGLLCRKCNSGIALFGENIARLKAAIGYLET